MAGTIAQAPQNGNDTVNLRHAGVQFGISGRKHSDRRQYVSRASWKHPIHFVTTGVSPPRAPPAWLPSGQKKPDPRRSSLAGAWFDSAVCAVARQVWARHLAHPELISCGGLTREGCGNDHNHGKRAGCESHEFEHRLAPYVSPQARKLVVLRVRAPFVCLKI